MTVDILKGLQSEDAYAILLDAQPKLNTEMATLTGTAANDLKDLDRSRPGRRLAVLQLALPS